MSEERWHRLMRRLRWWGGHGWRREDFERRYREKSEDAWGYSYSEPHARRIDSVLAALPEGRRFKTGFEAGCAEGHLTRKLAERVERLVACDLSPEAVRRAERRVGGGKVSFVVADVREELPVGGADLMVFSDVLYYLSVPEVDRAVVHAARAMEPGGLLVFANEWLQHYRGMCDPETILARFTASGFWDLMDCRCETGDGAASQTVAVLRRREEPSSE